MNASSVADLLTISPEAALKELLAWGFLRKWPTKCTACKRGHFSAPLPRASGEASTGKLYVRCSYAACNQRRNVTDFSVFAGTRLSLPMLHKVVVWYTRCNKHRFPLVSEAQGQLQLGRTCVEHVFDALREREARAGKAWCQSQTKLRGAVEGDGHAVRKIYVSDGNSHFQQETAAARQRWTKKNGNKHLPKYWLGYIRLAALKQRNGPVVVAPLPLVLHPPGSAPVTESLKDLEATSLHQNLPNSSHTQLHSDGARSWPTWCSQKKPKVQKFHVKHNKHEFAKKVKSRKKPGFVVAGTQCIDRWWQSLENAFPNSLHVKNKGHGGICAKLMLYVWGFVWRSNLPNRCNLTKELGQIMA